MIGVNFIKCKTGLEHINKRKTFVLNCLFDESGEVRNVPRKTASQKSTIRSQCQSQRIDRSFWCTEWRRFCWSALFHCRCGLSPCYFINLVVMHHKPNVVHASNRGNKHV